MITVVGNLDHAIMVAPTARPTPVIYLLSERSDDIAGRATAADIASALGHPHGMITREIDGTTAAYYPCVLATDDDGNTYAESLTVAELTALLGRGEER